MTDLEKLLDKKMQPLMEMQQQLIDQNIRLSNQLSEALKISPPAPPNTPKNHTRARGMAKSRGIVIDKLDDGSLTLSGNTFDIKDTIKSLGGTWNPSHSSWVVDGSKNNPKGVQAALEDAGAEQVTISCASW